MSRRQAISRILFICHGNICRSTMAQFVMPDLVNKAGLADVLCVDSAATTNDEIGHPPHHGTVDKLKQVGVPVLPHRARKVRADEYDEWDLFVCSRSRPVRGWSARTGRSCPTRRMLARSRKPARMPPTWPIPGSPATSTTPTATCWPAAKAF